MYSSYKQYLSQNSPFMWSHRIEIPVAFISLCGLTIVWLWNANLWQLLNIDLSDYRQVNAIKMMTFLACLLLSGGVTIFWFSLLSRVMRLENSSRARSYPMFSVLFLLSFLANIFPFSVLGLIGVKITGTAFSSNFQDWVFASMPWIGALMCLGLLSFFVAFVVVLRMGGLILATISSVIAITFVGLVILMLAIGDGLRSEEYNAEFLARVVVVMMSAALLLFTSLGFLNLGRRIISKFGGVLIMCSSIIVPMLIGFVGSYYGLIDLGTILSDNPPPLMGVAAVVLAVTFTTELVIRSVARTRVEPL